MCPTVTLPSFGAMAVQLEAELERLYRPDFHLSHSALVVGQQLTAAPSCLTRQTDRLRQFIATDKRGAYLELRFSRDEFAFMSAMTHWLSSLSESEVEAFPDMTELVVRHFRQGLSLEILPLSELKAYAGRWEFNLWAVIQHYKTLSRHVHEAYQIALAAWYQAVLAST